MRGEEDNKQQVNVRASYRQLPRRKKKEKEQQRTDNKESYDDDDGHGSFFPSYPEGIIIHGF